MKLLFLSLCLVSCTLVQAQHLEAISEDSTQRKIIRVGQALECMLELGRDQVVVRGTLLRVDSTSFRVATKPGLFTTVTLAKVVRLRRVSQFYLTRFDDEPGSIYNPNALLTQHNTGYATGTDPAAVLAEMAATVIVGTGISIFRGDLGKLPKGPSAYRGWHFVARP